MRAESVARSANTAETRGHHYDGTFDLSWLAPGEMVRSTGDGTGACEIVTSIGRILCRLDVGDWLARDYCGYPLARREAALSEAPDA